MPAYDGPRNPNPAEGESAIIIYGYVPSLVLGIVALVCFGLLLGAHLFLLVRHRAARTFQALLAFGCAMEVVGYGFRLASHYKPFKVINFIIQYFMIVCAPIFFSAAIYLALAALLRHTPNPRAYCPLSPRALVTIFIVADVLTIGTQVTGAALIGVSESALARGESSSVTPDQANDILLAGLAVQSFAFLVFLVLLALFLVRLRRSHHPTKVSSPTTTSLARPPTLLLFILATSALLIFLRTLFRLAETAEGIFGSLSIHEAYFGALEFAPVVLALALWVAVPLGIGLKKMEMY